MDLIISKMEQSRSIYSLMDLRMVCKGWKDACQKYNVSIPKFNPVQTSEGLQSVCKAYPSLSVLHVSIGAKNHIADLDLGPLSLCSSLSSVCIANDHVLSWNRDLHVVIRDMSVNLACLPPSLRSLELVHAAPGACFDWINLAGLTRLKWSRREAFPEEVSKQLQRLPHLQVFLGSEIMPYRITI